MKSSSRFTARCKEWSGDQPLLYLLNLKDRGQLRHDDENPVNCDRNVNFNPIGWRVYFVLATYKSNYMESKHIYNLILL